MGDVHPTDTGQQKLAPDRRHTVVEIDLDTRLAQDLGGHQAGGAATDNGDVRGGVRGWLGHGGRRIG